MEILLGPGSLQIMAGLLERDPVKYGPGVAEILRGLAEKDYGVIQLPKEEKGG